METMTFARQAGAAVFLVTLTLSIQCAGIAVLIRMARASIERGVARLSPLHGAILMVRFSILVIVLHFCRFSCGQRSTAALVFRRGRPPFTFQPPAIRR